MTNLIFGFDKPEHSPGFLLWQTTVTWQRRIKKILDPFDISHAQFVILANLLWCERIKQIPTQTLIVHNTKLDKMTVSKSLKKLVAENYVKRLEHKKDTRAKSVSLTTKGKTLASKLVPMIEKIDQEFFGIISTTNQRSLVRILADLVSNLTI